jgi:hypothetical protein
MTEDRAWDVRVFDRIESGVDRTLLAENLPLTPTERLERMRKVLEFVEGARAALANRLPNAS